MTRYVWWFAAAIVTACGGPETRTDGGAGGSAASSAVGSTGVVSSGTGTLAPLPASFVVQGLVVDDEGAPVEEAMVMQGGRTAALLLTGADGTFSLELSYPGYGVPGVVATRQGYRSRGAEFLEVPDAPVTLVLYPVEEPDNVAYRYGDSGTGDNDPSTAYCGHCHATLARDWYQSQHRLAARNPLVQDLYAGVASAFDDAPSCAAAGGTWKTGRVPGEPTVGLSRCYLGAGVLPDLNTSCGGNDQPACDDPSLGEAGRPTAFGACADCHAPGIAGLAGGRDLHDAVDIAFEQGVFCDLCHKVRDVDLSQPPGAGRRLVLHRPSEPFDNPTAAFRPLFFGPLLDVPNVFMGASFQPVFEEAEMCAGCHQQDQPALRPGESLDPSKWPEGLPVHSTYREWFDGPYAEAGVTCQGCHMPPHFDLVNTLDGATAENASMTFGYPRPPDEIREHVFRGPLYQPADGDRLVDEALFVSVALSLEGPTVQASVSVANVGAGHAVPTGEPMRSLVMLVTATSTGCGTLDAVGGMTVNDVGGARAVGVVGAGVSVDGGVVSWPAAGSLAAADMVVRGVRPTGAFDDYTGVGRFADPALSPADKGLPIQAPVGEARVLGVEGSELTLELELPLEPGDIVYLGELADELADEQPSRALAGAPGYSFARVLTDSAGQRQVPHHRAIDTASDNRIPPGRHALTRHAFAVGAECGDVSVQASVLYRPRPLVEAWRRGWPASDHRIAQATSTITLPEPR